MRQLSNDDHHRTPRIVGQTLGQQDNLNTHALSSMDPKQVCLIGDSQQGGRHEIGRLFLVCGLCCVPITIPATCVLPFVLCAAFTFTVSGQEMGGGWIPGQARAEKVLADAITIDGRKEWICKFCSETNVWTRWRCRRCYSNIPAGLQGKHRQAVSAKNEGWSSGSSSSSGEEGKRPRDQDVEIKRVECSRAETFHVWAKKVENYVSGGKVAQVAQTIGSEQSLG